MTEKKTRKTEFKTSSSITLEPCFTPAHWSEKHYDEDLGSPGEFPFTRGIHPTMYRGQFWTMRQYAGFGTAEESNFRYHYLLSQGQTGLSVAFDLPTQMGLDSDHPRSRGEVGKVGVAIDSIEDMEILLRDIPLDKVSTSMTINATSAILLGLYLVVAEKQGFPFQKLRGTIQNDILKEYIARGTYIYPPDQSIRLVTDIMAFCHQHVPQWNTISVSGYHIREAGSTAAQEIAFTLSNALTYLERAKKRGLPVAHLTERLSFFFNVHNNFLEEIAKFRAARRLWAKLLKERFGIESPRALMLRFHAQTGGSTLTAQQPENNVVRVTLQALAAVLGGAQSLHTNSKDEALGLPTEEAVTTALRTQQIIAYETSVTDTVDPLGGSFAIESLTNALEEKALSYLTAIDKRGGTLRCIEEGYQQKEIQEVAYRYQQELEEKKTIVVGMNQFTQNNHSANKHLKIDPELEKKQVERLKKFKSKRDLHSTKNALDRLASATKGKDNLMPYIIEAVKAKTTLGEISDILRQQFGTYQAKSVI